MTDAIDFRKLLIEEKQRARQERLTRSSASKLSGSSRDNKSNGHRSMKDNITKEIKQLDNTPSTVVTNQYDEEHQRDAYLWDPAIAPKLCSYSHALSTKPSLLSSVFYVPRFLNSSAFINKTLIPWLQERPTAPDENNNEADLNIRWKQLKHSKRRVMLVDAALCPNRILPQPLQCIIDSLIFSGVFSSAEDERPNHMLINEYYPGMGIMAHTDGPEYNNKTATISIGDDHDPSYGVLLHFAPRLSSSDIGTFNEELMNSKSTPSSEMEVRLESNGSLVVFQEDAYTHYMHSINEVVEEYSTSLCANAPRGTLVRRGYRISITVRHKKKKTR